MKLVVNYSSSEEEEKTETPEKKKVQIQAFKKERESTEPDSRTYKGELGSLFAALPAPKTTQTEPSFGAAGKRSKVSASTAPILPAAGQSAPDTTTEPESKKRAASDEDEEFDFFSLEQRPLATLLATAAPVANAPVQGPAKPPRNDTQAPAVSQAKKEPFVFRPPKKEPRLEDIMGVKKNRDGSSITLQTITHSDQLGDVSRLHDLKDLTTSVDMGDPFEKLSGTFVASSGTHRVNSIMAMAHKAKQEHAQRELQKQERKAVRKVVRQKYGF
ncbi:hypothetical protein HDU91_001358 [Kappamyces sp. JEL0680]|nr:hypothetical protein HDU91_001358 [Kappamyces sp. JEL0680]